MNSEGIELLNSFLRGEISAVETHKIAVDKLAKSSFGESLRRNQASHEARVRQLQGEIVKLGGTPDTSSGVWGTFAKLVEGSAAMFGEKAAIAALEEGEDHGIKAYESQLDKVAHPMRAIVQSLLAEQAESHAVMSNLKRSMKETKAGPHQPGT